MIPKAAEPLRTLRKVGSEALLIPPSGFLIVGDEVLVSGRLSARLKTPRVVSLSTKPANPITSLADYQSQFEKSQALGLRSVAEFTLSRSVLRRLRALAKEMDSTHVRFLTDEKRAIVARLFDVRVGSDRLLPRMKRIHASATLNVAEDFDQPFSLTITVETLGLLPADDLLMSVYDDGILEAEPVNSKLQHVFACRDQGVIEPYTSFQHKTLNRTVYFVHHPTE